ncbi:hypothetical protein [Streptomyces sp. bgisy022]|uniref:hypothetical protein n=1 Tax=Streptomyces sp. bgisy022 TaxID=3413769 RepID=UPI003D70560B
MTSTAVRRTALAASAAALALLVTACGGSGDDKAAEDKKGDASAPASSAPASSGKALTAAELEKAALAQADVKDGKVVTKLPASDDASADQVTAADKACQPLALLQGGVPVGSPAATVKRSWTGEAEKPAADADPEEALLAGLGGGKMIITLASYEDGGAEQVIKDVDAATEKCAGGYAYTAVGEKTKAVKVTAADRPEGADEGRSVTVDMELEEGLSAPMKVVVARKGSTVVSFAAVDFAALAKGEDFDFPAEIADAQLAKLD